MAAAGITYHGYNVHDYTQKMRQISQELPPHHMRILVEPSIFSNCMREMRALYGNKVALHNMSTQYTNGWIRDRDLPGVNVAAVVIDLWTLLNRSQEPTLFAHFSETLDTIGATCIQGISHRIIWDYITICRDEVALHQTDQI